MAENDLDVYVPEILFFYLSKKIDQSSSDRKTEKDNSSLPPFLTKNIQIESKTVEENKQYDELLNVINDIIKSDPSLQNNEYSDSTESEIRDRIIVKDIDDLLNKEIKFDEKETYKIKEQDIKFLKEFYENKENSTKFYIATKEEEPLKKDNFTLFCQSITEGTLNVNTEDFYCISLYKYGKNPNDFDFLLDKVTPYFADYFDMQTMESLSKLMNDEKLFKDLIMNIIFYNNSENFVKKIKELNSSKREQNNFYIVFKYIINLIINEQFEINNDLKLIKFFPKENNENPMGLIDNFFKPLNLIIKEKKSVFVDRTCWKGRQPEEDFLREYMRLYLLFFKYNIPLFTTIFKDERSNSRLSNYNNLKSSIDDQLNLKKNNIIREDDLFSLVYFNELKNIFDVNLISHIYTMIPMIKIFYLYCKKIIGDDKNKEKKISKIEGNNNYLEIVSKYFELLNDIKKQSFILFMSEEDYKDNNELKNSYFNENDSTKEMIINVEDLYKKLPFNSLLNPQNGEAKEEHYIVKDELFDKVSYMLKIPRVRINKYNDHLFKIFSYDSENNKILLQFKDKNDSNDFLYSYLRDIVSKDKSISDNSNFLKEVSNPIIKSIICEYIKENLVSILDKIVDESIEIDCSSIEKFEKESFNLVNKKLAESFKEIYLFLKNNYIIEVIQKGGDENIISFNDFKKSLENDFKENKILINDTDKINDSICKKKQIFFINIIYNSFSKIKDECLENYRVRLKNIESPASDKGNFDNEINEKIKELSKRLPNFIEQIKNINSYIEEIILKDCLLLDPNNANKDVNIILQIINIINNTETSLYDKKTNISKLIYTYIFFMENKKIIYLLDLLCHYVMKCLKTDDYNKIFENIKHAKINDENITKKSVSIQPLLDIIETVLDKLNESNCDNEGEPIKFYLDNYDRLNYIVNTAEVIGSIKNIFYSSDELRRLKFIQNFLKLIKFNDLLEVYQNEKNEKFNEIIKYDNYSSLFTGINSNEYLEKIKKDYNANNNSNFIDYHLFMIDYYIDLYKKNEDKLLRKEIIYAVLDDYLLITHSKKFFMIILQNIIDFTVFKHGLKQETTTSTDFRFQQDLKEEDYNFDISENLNFESDENNKEMISTIEDYLNNQTDDNINKIKALEQILINIFENVFIPYFISHHDNSNEEEGKENDYDINNSNNKMDDNSEVAKYLINKRVTSYIYHCIKYLYKLNPNSEEIKDNCVLESEEKIIESDKYKNIKKLIIISFLKVYFNGYYRALQSNNTDDIDFSWVSKIITDQDSPESDQLYNIRKVIQIYILKQIRRNLPSFTDFQRYSFINHQMLWASNFKFREKHESNFEFRFFSAAGQTKEEEKEKNLIYIDEYRKLSDIMTKLSKETYRTGNFDKDIIEIIKSDYFEVFIDFCINSILSNCYDEDYLKGLEYNEFTMWIENLLKTNKDLFSNFTESNYVKDFFNVLFQQKNFLEYILRRKENKDNEENDIVDNDEEEDRNKDAIKDMKTLEILLIALKISFSFIVNSFCDLEDLDKKIFIEKKIILELSIFLDMGNHLNFNKINIQDDYYLKVKEEKEKEKENKKDSDFKDDDNNNWKLIDINDKEHFYKDNKITFTEEKVSSNEIQRFIHGENEQNKPIYFKNENTRTNKYSPTMVSIQNYNLIYHQANNYFISKKDQTNIATFQILSFILYSLHYTLSIILKSKGENTDEFVKVHPEFLANIYNDAVESLHCLLIDNEKIFFNLLYQDLKAKFQNFDFKKDFIKTIHVRINFLLVLFTKNKTGFINYIHSISEPNYESDYIPESMRNLLEDQKIIYNEKDQQEIIISNESEIKNSNNTQNNNYYDNLFPFLFYFYYSKYPTFENFVKEFEKIYRRRNKFPLIYYVVEKMKTEEFNLNNAGKEIIDDMINELFIYGNDHTKNDIKNLMNYGGKNKFKDYDNNNIKCNDEFIYELIRDNSYRNVFCAEKVNYCNGDIIRYDFYNIENELEKLLIGHCMSNKTEN